MNVVGAELFATPVALFIHRRPDTTARVLEAMARVRPALVLVVADGPRPGQEKACNRTRALVEGAVRGWGGELRALYAETNMGLRARFNSGLRWVFEQVPEAVILEDDCVPHPTFFPYCAELLERFRHDTRVMAISGTRVAPRDPSRRESYVFSSLFSCWGWATWRRAHALFDEEMAAFNSVDGPRVIRQYYDDPADVAFWMDRFRQAVDGRISSWDTAWHWSHWLQGGLTCVPACNLVSNIGFGGAATHTHKVDDPVAALPAAALAFPLVHPVGRVRDVAMDAAVHSSFYDRSRRTRLRKALGQLAGEVLALALPKRAGGSS